MIFLFITSLSIFIACSSLEKLKTPSKFTSVFCQNKFFSAEKLETVAQLDMVSDLFSFGCFEEVISLANHIRNHSRDKFYSISAEMFEVFTPEGSLTPYILESYERSFLSLLISFSYLNINLKDDALVEMRRTLSDENAFLYNYGRDPVISLLLAAMWDRFDPSVARAQWLKLSHFSELGDKVVNFAKSRVEEIDRDSSTPVDWKIYGIGQMPDLDWHSHFLSEKPYLIRPVTSYPTACSSKDSLMLPADSWTKKIAAKYDSSYHPLLFAKSLARLPIGIGYGVIGISSGVAVGIGGCGLASQVKDGGEALCKTSLQAAGYIINKSSNLVSYTLRPDLRHWKKLPLALVVTKDSQPGLYVKYCEQVDTTPLKMSLVN